MTAGEGRWPFQLGTLFPLHLLPVCPPAAPGGVAQSLAPSCRRPFKAIFSGSPPSAPLSWEGGGQPCVGKQGAWGPGANCCLLGLGVGSLASEPPWERLPSAQRLRPSGHALAGRCPMRTKQARALRARPECRRRAQQLPPCRAEGAAHPLSGGEGSLLSSGHSAGKPGCQGPDPCETPEQCRCLFDRNLGAGFPCGPGRFTPLWSSHGLVACLSLLRMTGLRWFLGSVHTLATAHRQLGALYLGTGRRRHDNRLLGVPCCTHPRCLPLASQACISADPGTLNTALIMSLLSPL